MARVTPFYSNNPSDPDVYHDDSECSRGKAIPASNRRAGTNGYRRCLVCS